MTYAFLPSAQQELVEAAAWYDSRCEGVGDEFLDAVQRKLDALVIHPTQYPRVPHTKRLVRAALVDRFPFVIYFEGQADRILVVAIAHGRRRPGYWQSRLR